MNIGFNKSGVSNIVFPGASDDLFKAEVVPVNDTIEPIGYILFFAIILGGVIYMWNMSAKKEGVGKPINLKQGVKKDKLLYSFITGGALACISSLITSVMEGI